MEQEQRNFNILIEVDLYELYNTLKDITDVKDLEEMKKDIVREFVEENKANPEYDAWNNEQYVTNYLNKMIKKSKDKDDWER